VIPTFVIFLREGIEASMIVAILLAYLDRVGQRRYFRDIYMGVGAALVLALAGGVAAYVLIHQYAGSRVQTIFETITYLIAAAALTYMTFWMGRHARTLGKELERQTDVALSSGSRIGMSALAFTAVGREGLETMVFTLAIVFASSAQSATGAVQSRSLIIGALAGLFVAAAMAVAMYKLGKRMNLKIFFRVLGVLLMLFAAGLLADAVENMQQLGWLPMGGRVLWNSSGIISEDSSLGDVFHSLIGYAERPTVLQAIVWTGYLVIAVTIFIRISRPKQPPGKPSGPSGELDQTLSAPEGHA
jgi:high-affinity iron transporter